MFDNCGVPPCCAIGAALFRDIWPRCRAGRRFEFPPSPMSCRESGQLARFRTPSTGMVRFRSERVTALYRRLLHTDRLTVGHRQQMY